MERAGGGACWCLCVCLDHDRSRLIGCSRQPTIYVHTNSDASGSSEISRIVQKELQAYLEHRKNLATPDSEGGSEDGSEDGSEGSGSGSGDEGGDGESYMEEDEEGLVELVTVDDDDDDEEDGSEKNKKGVAGVEGGARPPSRASSSGASRRDSTGSVNSAGSRKRQSYSLLESIVDSEESEED